MKFETDKEMCYCHCCFICQFLNVSCVKMQIDTAVKPCACAL